MLVVIAVGVDLPAEVYKSGGSCACSGGVGVVVLVRVVHCGLLGGVLRSLGGSAAV